MRNDAPYNAAALVRAKNEGLVFLDWPAKRSAKLVLLEGRLRRGLECESVGIQDVIAQKLIDTAMKIVRSRFGNYVDHCPRIAPVFRVKGIGDYAKLFDAVR